MLQCDEPGCEKMAAFCINGKAYCPSHEVVHRHELAENQYFTDEQIQLLMATPDKKDLFLNGAWDEGKMGKKDE